ncbi:transcriptional regulator [Pedobacter fastidiosus]|uniref:Plasmid maintenance system antidote protein n=1 Tax=Pedobacter fastidiosus TaxID=2765361 RepID=A0ABR7KW00_9SPHI|nr:plasmid maintenance system antidote protein [Pedobacter fastidiosus]MBC6112221.1 plasmid maintenance system antidote protein [Pedobacter fastidiosus]
MNSFLDKYKGIHPGLILERELAKRNLKKGPFALSLREYPQILNDITKGKRGLTTSLSLKIDQALGFEEGTMLIFQVYHDIKKEKEKNNISNSPDLSIFRNGLFWDTEINKIDWQKQYIAVIERVFERGNEKEKEEIIRFYGKEKVTGVTSGQKEIKILKNLKIN